MARTGNLCGKRRQACAGMTNTPLPEIRIRLILLLVLRRQPTGDILHKLTQPSHPRLLNLKLIQDTNLRMALRVGREQQVTHCHQASPRRIQRSHQACREQWPRNIPRNIAIQIHLQLHFQMERLHTLHPPMGHTITQLYRSQPGHIHILLQLHLRHLQLRKVIQIVHLLTFRMFPGHPRHKACTQLECPRRRRIPHIPARTTMLTCSKSIGTRAARLKQQNSGPPWLTGSLLQGRDARSLVR